jgi:hypothetical protein
VRVSSLAQSLGTAFASTAASPVVVADLRFTPISRFMKKHEPEQSSCRKATFGKASLVCFCFAAGLWFFFITVQSANFGHHVAFAVGVGVASGTGGDSGIGPLQGYQFTLAGATILPVVGLACALTGIVRAERPRWPAIVGLVLCAIPSSLTLFELGRDTLGYR